MKKNLLFLLLFLPYLSFSQFSDDFSDGLFKSTPSATREVEWQGDEDYFIVNDALQLQLNATGKISPASLRTPSSLSSNGCWEFRIKLGFNPTSSNYAKVLLCGDWPDEGGEPEGLFVRVGYSAKNLTVILSGKDGSSRTLISGPSSRLNRSSVTLQVKVTWDKAGNLKLYSKLDDETEYLPEGGCILKETLSGTSFGVVCHYTSTRAKAFFFDDFAVRELSEEEQEPEEVQPELPGYGEILFSEIMANPADASPEYVELYNASGKDLQLKECLFYYGDNSYKLPESIVSPGDYFVLCKNSALSSFPENCRALGVTSFPTLANSGKLLLFTAPDGTLVSWFEYSDKMYGDDEKKGGGYSLECIDLDNLSNLSSNWSGSLNQNGSPGRGNSVEGDNPDLILPRVTGVETTADNRLHITFSKPMDRKSLLDKNSFVWSEPSVDILDLEVNYPYGTVLEMELDRYPPVGEMVILTLEGVRDLSGNGLEEESKFIGVGLGHEASPKDLIINEILFNPPEGGTEYVELFNRSEKALDLRFLSLSSRKPSDGSLNSAWPLSAFPELLEPGEYLLVSEKRELVCPFYKCRDDGFFAEPERMPSLANTSGCVVLLNNRTNEVVDEVPYNEKMHASGISNKKGIALERLSAEAPSDTPDNWQSASEQSGYGTPGYENSQRDPSAIPALSGNPFRVIYGTEDPGVYRIEYRLDRAGYRCNALVFDASGRQVDCFANNMLLGTEGVLIWDAPRSRDGKWIAGIYILWLEIYHETGETSRYRMAIPVGR